MNELIGAVNTFWPFLILIAVFYFFMWRPQKKEEKRRAEFLASLKKGAHVVTAGGIHGVIRAIREDSLLLEVAPKVQIRVDRHAIQKYAGKSAPIKAEKPSKHEKEEAEEAVKEAPAAEAPKAPEAVSATAAAETPAAEAPAEAPKEQENK